MNLLKILLTFLFVNFCLLAQTAQNVQLLDTKLGSQIYTNPPWDPTSPTNDRFGGGWGYTDQSTGDKYYYSGNRRGFAVFNVTDPANIQVLPPISHPEGVTHIKTYSSSNGDYLYTTPGADIRNDVVIYRLFPNPGNPFFANTIPVGEGSDIKMVHDLYIEDGVLYLACLDNDGDSLDTETPQLFMYDLRDSAENPVRIGSWIVPRYVPHTGSNPYPENKKGYVPGIGEVWVKDNRIYCSGGTAGIYVATFYDSIGTGGDLHRIINEDSTWVITYQMLRDPDESPGFENYRLTHTVKATDDHQYVFVCDETLPSKPWAPKPSPENQGGVLRMFDISNIESFKPISQLPPYQNLEPVQIYEAPENMSVGRIVSTNDSLIYPNNPPNSIHKVFLHNNFAYIGYYSKGLRILDISDILNWKEVGYYDTPGTATDPDHSWFSGSWSVFPFWGNDHIIVPNYDGTITFKFGESGTINTATTWSGTKYIIGDIVIDENATLTIEPGTEINFVEGDISNSGEDPNLSEIIVNGNLITNGTSGNEIVFNSASTWYGIVVAGYANIELNYTKISNAERGVYLKPQLELPWLSRTFNNCNISNCEYGIYSSNNNLNISNSTISDNNTAIRILAGNTIINDNTISNNNIGIYLYNSQFDIYDNTVSSNSRYGIYLSHSSEGYITNNLMNLNSDYGNEYIESYSAIFLYNSSPYILGNHIYSNYKNGILLANNSFPIIQESNLLSQNGPLTSTVYPIWNTAEICCRDICMPYINYGHNDIIDTREEEGYVIIHTGEIEEKIDISGNYWGGNSPEGKYYPEDYFTFEDWDDEPNVTSEPSGGDTEELLFIEGQSAEIQNDFNTAKIKYNQIISDYPDSLETTYALPRLLICEIKLGGDLTQLANFYTTLSQTFNDPSVSKISLNLSRRCEVQQMLFNDAIVGYEQIVNSPSSLADSIYAIIDIGDIYILQNELSINGSLPKLSTASLPDLIELQPANTKVFEEKKQELFSLLFSTSKNIKNNLIPKVFSLKQNYPNPFNPITTIEYQLPKVSKVKLEIFNILGQKVKTLIDEQKEAAIYQLKWDGLNDYGRQVSTGIYFYHFSAEALDGSNNIFKTKKMLLIR